MGKDTLESRRAFWDPRVVFLLQGQRRCDTSMIADQELIGNSYNSPGKKLPFFLLRKICSYEKCLFFIGAWKICSRGVVGIHG